MCGEHCLQVTYIFFRCPTICAENTQKRFVPFTGAAALHRRDRKAFLEQFIAGWRYTARHLAADIGGMQERPTVTDDFAIVEIWHNDVQIGCMRAQPLRLVGMIGKNHISRFQCAHRADGRAAIQIDKTGDAYCIGVGEELPVEIHQCRREIRCFLDVERPPGTHQSEAHFIRYGKELIVHNFQRHWIELH